MIHFKKQTEKWFKIQFLFKKTPKLIFFLNMRKTGLKPVFQK
jgi:hypothetical protein